jgi:hypothetical protein
MKKIFVLTMLTVVAVVCSCQKNDSVTEQQLAQRKVELDTREEELAERKSTLDEREKALDEREKSSDKEEKTTMNVQTSPTEVQSQISDPAQAQAERDREIQESSAAIPDSLQSDIEKVEKEREIQRAQRLPGLRELQGQQQLGADEIEKQKQRKLEAAGISPTPQ